MKIGLNTDWGWSQVARWGDVETGSSSTGSSSPEVASLVNKLAGGIKSAYKPGGSTYVAPSSSTTSGWNQALGAAGNADYAGGLAGALSSYGKRAAGEELGANDPLYAAQRTQMKDDVLTDVGSIFTENGRFGSGSHVDTATRSLASALAPIDAAQRAESYGRQSEAADKLSSLYQGSLLPSSVTGAVGAAQDADARAKQLGGIDYLGQFMSLLNGASGAAGTTTTTESPWWKIGLGAGATALGI